MDPITEVMEKVIVVAGIVLVFKTLKLQLLVCVVVVGLAAVVVQYLPEIWTLILWPFIFHGYQQVITSSTLLFLSATLKLIGSSISTMLKTSLKRA